MKPGLCSERGQAIVLLVFGMVALLGFTALAIDGGSLYTERRQAQNAADSAALAGALELTRGGNSTTVRNAALGQVVNNGYVVGQASVQIQGPLEDFISEYFLVQVALTSTVDTSFIHFVYEGPSKVSVNAVGRARRSHPPMGKFAIVALGNCTEKSGPDNLLYITGGGNRAAVETFRGGIFLNSPENSANRCAMDPPTSTDSIGLQAHDGRKIYSVGSVDYSGEGKIGPLPVVAGINGGSPIGDPLSELPEPQCTSSGSKDPGTGNYKPGNWSGGSIGPGIYEPGIYCISGDVHISGKEGIDASSGVTFYLMNGGLNFTGQGGMTLVAPSTATCGPLPAIPNDPKSPCTYRGIGIFAARSNTSVIGVKGNGGDAVVGLVYGLNATVLAQGGGSGSTEETNITGQLIARQISGGGNGSFKVTYEDSAVYWKQPEVSMHR